MLSDGSMLVWVTSACSSTGWAAVRGTRRLGATSTSAPGCMVWDTLGWVWTLLEASTALGC
jgi:hypothetical protein